MKLGILAIVLGVLGIGGYINFQLSGQSLILHLTENGMPYGVRDWSMGLVLAIIGLVLIALGVYRIKIKRLKV